MRGFKMGVKLVNDINNALNAEDPVMAVKELMDKAYDMGWTRGRESGINDIFTFHPDEDE